MTAQDIGAIAASVMAGIAILGLVANAGAAGSRLKRAETDIEGLKTRVDEHAKAISPLEQMLSLLQEVRNDVKDIITGRTKIQASRPDDAD